jgi:hypothetical protein
VPLLKTLTASLSGRYDKYENVNASSDSKATWKLAWSSVPGIRC